MPTRHVRDTGARFASQLTGWLRDRAQAMRDVVDALRDLNRRVTKLEVRMATLNEALTELNVATNDVAAELEEIRAALAAGDTTAADRIAPVTARLRAMAVDPNNPVPDSGGDVESGGGTV